VRITELRNVTIGVEHQAGDENGVPEMWRLTFTDKRSGDVVFCAFTPEVKAQLMRMLMGGGLILPEMQIPKGPPRT
jgi:hypothetical protein